MNKKLLFTAIISCMTFMSSCSKNSASDTQTLNGLLESTALSQKVSAVTRLGGLKDAVFMFKVKFGEDFTHESFRDMGFTQVHDEKSQKHTYDNIVKFFPELKGKVGSLNYFKGSAGSSLWMEVIECDDTLLIFGNRY